jgi:hypothetical protein
MKTELIQKLEELLLKDAGEVASDVRTLQKEYQKQRHLEFEKARQTFIEAGGNAKDFDLPPDANDKHFDELLLRYQQLRKEQDAKIASEQTRNLILRQEIIAKIKDLSHLSENVGAARCPHTNTRKSNQNTAKPLRTSITTLRSSETFRSMTLRKTLN